MKMDDNLSLAIADYMGPDMPSFATLAARYSIPETTLRRKLKERGIFRNPDASNRKRQQVEAHFAGVDESTIEDAANQDIADMQSALDVARGCLARLKQVVQKESDPRELKSVMDATEKAVTVIRRIRGLDAPVSFEDWTNEELETLATTGRIPASRR